MKDEINLNSKYLCNEKAMDLSKQKSQIIHQMLNKDEEERTPVKGLRILSSTEFKQRYASNQVQNIKGNCTFICRLCQVNFAGPQDLAEHKCARIESLRYNCPECKKEFSSPANLASHRRWHKEPKAEGNHVSSRKRKRDGDNSQDKKRVSVSKKSVKLHVDHLLQTCKPVTSTSQEEDLFPCTKCKKKFRRRSFLKRHFDKKHMVKQSNDNKLKPNEEVMLKTEKNSNGDIKSVNSHAANHSQNFYASGLDALADAAEIHLKAEEQRLSNRTPVVENNSAIRELNFASPKITIKAENWLPPSPPLSITLSPLSSVADDSDSNASSLELSPIPHSVSKISASNNFIHNQQPMVYRPVITKDQNPGNNFIPPYFPYPSGHQNAQALTTTEQFFPHPQIGPFPGGCNNPSMFSRQHIAAWKAWTSRAWGAWSNRNHLPTLMPSKGHYMNL